MALELKRLCRIIANVINDRDFDYRSPEAQDLLKNHIDPHWEGRFDNVAHTMSFAQQNEAWRQLTVDHPDFYIELVGLNFIIHKDQSSARVIMQSYLPGEAGLMLQGVCEMSWKLQKGRWVWWYHCAIKGLREV